MRAVVISQYGGPEVLVQTELPDPNQPCRCRSGRSQQLQEMVTSIWPRS